MIASLLVVTLVVAVIVASAVAFVFNKPIASILNRVVPPELSYAWVSSNSRRIGGYWRSSTRS
jgi:hypothetical protein